MKLKKGFKLRELCKEFILTPDGSAQVNFNKMIALNETAAFLWRKAVEMDEFTAQDLAGFLLEEYEVDGQTALKDSEAIMTKWAEAGITEQ